MTARFNIAAKIPLGGQTSFKDIAEGTGLDEGVVRRLLRHAMTMRVFQEPVAGMVSHTKTSKALLDPAMCDWLRVGTEEMWPAAVKVRSSTGLQPEFADCLQPFRHWTP